MLYIVKVVKIIINKGGEVMCKRFVVTVVLCVGLTAMMGVNDAKAWPRITGWGMSSGSVHCDAFLQGIGNPDVNPLYVDCGLSNITMAVQCMNNGGGTGGEGNPFTFEGATSTSYPITWDSFTSKGKATADVEFTDNDLYLLIEAYLAAHPETEICQNPNWSIISPDEGGTVTVLSTDVCITIEDEDGSYYFVEGNCVLNADDPDDLFYACTESGSGKGYCENFVPPAAP